MVFYEVLVFILYVRIEPSSTISEDQVELFRTFCPYSNFCESKSSLVLNQTISHRPCCMNCFCDPACFVYGDCCPEKVLEGPKNGRVNVQAKCKSAVYKNEYTESWGGLINNYPSYRIVDTCPPSYRDDDMTREKCEGNFTEVPSYDDIVMVSTNDTGLFQNKHCARCNNVTKTTRWNLEIIRCQDKFDWSNITASEASSHFVQTCGLISTRPSDAAVNERTTNCRLRSTCLNNVADENIRDACINGPYMPYTSDSIGKISHYRNVMCYKCSVSGAEQENICLKDEQDPNKSTIKSIRILLNLHSNDGDLTKPRSTECGESEIYDNIWGGCRRVYCPVMSVVHYGRCLPVSERITNMNLVLNIFFSPMDNNFVKTYKHVAQYRAHVVQFYMNRIRKNVNLPKCSIDMYEVGVARERSDWRLLFLHVSVRLDINYACSVEYIGKALKDRQNIKQTWLINNDTVAMTGKYSFFDRLKDTYQLDILLHESNTLYIKTIEQFFVCPYFILSASEYSDRVSRSVIDGRNETIDGLSPTSVLEHGYYVLTEDRIAACVNTYLKFSTSKAENIVIPLWLVLVLTFATNICKASL